MILSDFHSHTVYCDGKNTPGEMIRAAISRGMNAFGLSGHSYAVYNEGYCMTPEGTLQFRAEVERYKELCDGIIKIYCGVEQDVFAPAPDEPYDYMIGSVHYLDGACEPLPLDYKPEILKQLVDESFGSDIYALCEAYFEAVSEAVERTGCDIIGHFDLISKFNEGDCLFDSNNERYVNAWKRAADKLLKTGALFEINTGAMSRGYRTSPYPSEDMILYIAQKGGRFMLNSDAHTADGIMYAFPEQEKRMSELGIELVDFSAVLDGTVKL